MLDVDDDLFWYTFDSLKLNIINVLTVSISLSQQLHLHGKSYFWTKFFLQPPETQKTLN
jgi:hypothetical protein